MLHQYITWNAETEKPMSRGGITTRKCFAHCGWSGNFLDDLETLRMVWKLSGWSGNGNDPEMFCTFRMIWKLSGWAYGSPGGFGEWRWERSQANQNELNCELTYFMLNSTWLLFTSNIKSRRQNKFIETWNWMKLPLNSLAATIVCTDDWAPTNLGTREKFPDADCWSSAHISTQPTTQEQCSLPTLVSLWLR